MFGLDIRTERLARTLVRYCIGARRNWEVGITAGPAAEPLILAAYRELLDVGAFPSVRMMSNELMRILLVSGRPHHFTTVSRLQLAATKITDAIITIQSETNTNSLAGTDPRRMGQLMATDRPLKNIRLKKPWVYTLYPTPAYAQDAGMSLEAFADFVFEATFSDRADPIREWEKLGERQKTIVARLCGADTMRIVGGETDLRLSVKGRPFTSCDGRINMPCGEVFAAPIEHSADGKIFFDVPSCWSGREISGIRIVFRRGRVVEASAEKNGKFLSTLIATDAGASRIGELAIGTNFRIRRFTKNILFDEKVGGTVHLALGNAYPESGGKNKSAIHWDMIKDLRKDGAVYVDGRPLLKNGKFV